MVKITCPYCNNLYHATHSCRRIREAGGIRLEINRLKEDQDIIGYHDEEIASLHARLSKLEWINWSDEGKKIKEMNKELFDKWADNEFYHDDDIVILDGSIYQCIEYHWSTKSDKPESGISWSTYWKYHGEFIVKDEYAGGFNELRSSVLKEMIDENNHLREVEANLLNEQRELKKDLLESEAENIRLANKDINLNFENETLQERIDNFKEILSKQSGEYRSLKESRDVLVEKAYSASKKLNVAEKMYRAARKARFGYRDYNILSGDWLPIDIRNELSHAIYDWEKINDRVDVAGENFEEDDCCQEKEGLEESTKLYIENEKTEDGEDEWVYVFPNRAFNEVQIVTIKQMIKDAIRDALRE